MLSVWQWSSALDPPTYSPVPLTLNVGYWIREDPRLSEHQWWVEAYTDKSVFFCVLSDC